MVQKESRRGFLKKMLTLAAGAVVTGTVVGVTRLGGQKDRLEQIYDVVKRTSQSGMSLRPCIDQKGRMRTGFGCFVTESDFVKMGIAESPLRGHNIYPFSGDKADLYKEITCENRAGRNHTYVFDNGSIRRHTMLSIRRIEPDILNYVPNYHKLPVKVQGLLVQTYIKTDGDLQSYPVMCQSFNAGRFNVPEKDMALKKAVNLYDVNFDLGKINRARMSVLKEIQAEQLTLRNQANQR